jgi:hypothetical protein
MENELENILYQPVDKQTEYEETIKKMFSDSRTGALPYYLMGFLLSLPHDTWWSQPQALAYINRRVVEDGGVGWNTRAGGKKDADGNPLLFGDSGRTIEKIRCEKYDGCWDNQTGKKHGPFRLNLDKFREYKGSTKCHAFSEKDKKEIRKRAGGRCEMCGYKGTIEIDHFIPKEKGGESTLENGNALCGRCNDRKCNKEPRLFMCEEITRMKTYFSNRGLESELKDLIKELFDL